VKQRNRKVYALLIIIVIILGLASRKFSYFLPSWLANYSGDTLWALMVFFIIGFIFAKRATLWVGATALVFSFMIELSQLYHKPWIDTFRATRLGALVLGFGFLWGDLICYSVGIMIGILLERAIKKR
jgi:hypothetical protein